MVREWACVRLCALYMCVRVRVRGCVHACLGLYCPCACVRVYMCVRGYLRTQYTRFLKSLPYLPLCPQTASHPLFLT